MEEEVSLRDLYLILKRAKWLITGLALGFAALTFLITSLVPKTYQSQSTVLFSTGSAMPTELATISFPKPGTLATGFTQALLHHSIPQLLTLSAAGTKITATYNAKSALLSITATGPTPQEARAGAIQTVNVFSTYTEQQVLKVVQTGIGDIRANLSYKQSAVQSQLEQVEAVLKSTPPMLGKLPASLALAETLQTQRVNPLVATAANPVFAYLGLQITQLKAQLAQVLSSIQTLDTLKTIPQQLARRAIRLQTLIPASTPLSPVAPRRGLYTLLAAVLGLVLGISWAFMREALKEPPTRSND